MPGVRDLSQAEAASRARLLDVTSYDITVDLTGAPDHAGSDTFRSVTEIRFRCREPGSRVVVEAAASHLRSATLNGAPLDLSGWSATHGLTLPELAEDNTLVVDGDFAYSGTGQGLTRSTDPADGEVYLHSQFEIADAQRVFACFDQPDLKSVFTWHVVAPRHWRVVSNAPVAAVDDGDPYRTVHFAQSVRMSTYITALCAGPFFEQRRTHDGLDLGYFCRASMAPHFDVDVLHEVTTQGFDFFRRQFDHPYPLDKYDQLWVPDFNAGAMENFGAVVHSEAHYVFRSQVTEFEYEQRANTILHELAHMWFGNLVTMRWWDDLWLNESFAEWASHWCNVHATRYTDAWTTFLSVRKNWGYRQDQLSSTHPVYCEMPDTAAVEVNFDGITYAKGASVLKQLVAYVGEDAFLNGLRSYFRRHAWGNATFDDLLAALSAASGRQLDEFAAQWLQASEVNTLRPEVAVGEDGAYTRVTVHQTAPDAHPTLRTHRLAIGLYDLDDGKLARRERLELDVAGARTDVPALAGVPACDLLLLNDDDLTYAKIRLDDRSRRTALQQLTGLDSSLARGLCWGAMWDMLRDAELPARDWLALMLRALPRETDINLVTATLRQARGTLTFYTAEDHAATGWTRFAATAHQTVEAAAPGSDVQLAWARAFTAAATTDADLAVLRGWYDGAAPPPGVTVDTELRWSLLQTLVAHGAATAAEVDAMLEQDPTATGAREAATAYALRPTPEAKAQVWAELTGHEPLPNWRHRALLQGFWHPQQRALTAPYVAAFHAVAADVYARRDGDQGREFLTLGYPAVHVDPATVAASDTWLADTQHPPAARRLVAEGRDGVRRALAARTTDADAG